MISLKFLGFEYWGGIMNIEGRNFKFWVLSEKYITDGKADKISSVYRVVINISI